MREEWERVMHAAAASGGVGVLVGVVRIVVSHRYDGFWQWLSVLCGTVFVATMAGLVVADSDLSPAWSGAVVGLCPFVADNLILALLTLAKSLGANPVRAIRRISAALRGQPAPADSDKTPLQ